MADIGSSVDILMVEDNANDEALTLHELRKRSSTYSAPVATPRAISKSSLM